MKFLALRGLRASAGAVTVSAMALGVGQLVTAPQATARYASMTAVAAVNVRSDPWTTSTIVGVLSQGQRVQPVGSNVSGFVPITWKGKRAYVFAQYLSTATAETPAQNGVKAGVVYAVDAVRVRTRPSLAADVVGTLSQGQKVSRTGTTSGPWQQITYQGKQCWVFGSYLTTSAPTTTTPVTTTPVTKTPVTVVTTPTLPKIVGRARATTALMIRTTSGADYKSLGDIASGTIVSLTGVKQNGMAQIVYQNAVRWVNAAYLVAVAPTDGVSVVSAPVAIGTRYATVALNVRTTPTVDAVVIDEIPAGTAVKITGTVTSGFAQIIWSGTARWVTAQYLSASAPSSSGSSSSSSSSGAGTTTPTGVGLAGLTANAKLVLAASEKQFPQITTYYGVRPDPLPDHPSGHALDIMLPNYKSNEAMGWTIANYMRAHAKELGISYIIFHQKIWNIARDSEGWRAMADRGSDTANHFDHVHVTVF